MVPSLPRPAALRGARALLGAWALLAAAPVPPAGPLHAQVVPAGLAQAAPPESPESSARAETPEPLSWTDLPAVSAQVWAGGPGAHTAALAAGIDQGARRPQRGPSAVWVEVQRGVASQDQTTLALDLPLRLGRAETRAGSARADALRAEGRAAGAAWTEQVIDTWLAGWAARENVAHLGTFADEIASWLAPLESAAAAGLIARLDLAELRVERARVLAEQAASAEAAAAADARLSQLLGRPVAVDPGAGDLHARAPAPENPWAALRPLVGNAPVVAAAAAQAAAAQAERRAVWAEALPTASLGAMTVPTAEAGAPFAFAGLSVPLRTDGARRRAEAQAAAAGWSAEARWREAQLAARVGAEGQRWRAARDRAATLGTALIAPLEARQDQILAAFSQGLVPASRLIQARRDLHEAEHERILVTVSILASEARAEALRTTLTPAGGR